MVKQPVTIAKENITLKGFLGIPHLAMGIVIFAHAAGAGGSVRATASWPITFSRKELARYSWIC
jgi:hypothetical protein